MSSKKQLAADAYTVGIIYVKPIEMNAITAMIDEFHQSIPMRRGDDNEYTLGRIGKHNVAIAGPAKGAQGKVAIADVVGRIPLAFKNIRVGLLVGIGGGVPRPPRKDVRLGDVVVGAPESGPAVVQYDLGKQTTHEVEVMRTLNKPPGSLLRVVDKVDNEYQRAEEGEDDFFAKHLQRFAKFPRMRELYKRPYTADRLFQASYEHEDGTQCISHDQSCEVSRPDRNPGDIRIHYSTILSGDLVMESAKIRDQLSCKFHNALCFEMEAAGSMDVFPCLVIRGICDYSDSHKNKDWQEYAAATAAAYAREILLSMAERVVEELYHSATENSKTPEEAQPMAVNFFGNHNSGVQLGQNTGSISGLTFGRST
jgi:nucleoside phosphorylase